MRRGPDGANIQSMGIISIKGCNRLTYAIQVMRVDPKYNVIFVGAIFHYIFKKFIEY